MDWAIYLSMALIYINQIPPSPNPMETTKKRPTAQRLDFMLGLDRLLKNTSLIGQHTQFLQDF